MAGPEGACVSLCLAVTLCCSIILYIFAAMVEQRIESDTFLVVATKHGWDVMEKGKCCRHAALFYLIVFVLLVAVRVYQVRTQRRRRAMVPLGGSPPPSGVLGRVSMGFSRLKAYAFYLRRLISSRYGSYTNLRSASSGGAAAEAEEYPMSPLSTTLGSTSSGAVTVAAGDRSKMDFDTSIRGKGRGRVPPFDTLPRPYSTDAAASYASLVSPSSVVNSQRSSAHGIEDTTRLREKSARCVGSPISRGSASGNFGGTRGGSGGGDQGRLWGKPANV